MQRGLKWLIAFRIIFSVVLICSTLVFSSNESLPFDAMPFLAVYTLALLMLFLSLFYGLLFNKFSMSPLFAYTQLAIDSFSVSAIIFITGGFQSIFTFIYLVVIIAASILLLRRGSLIIATLCSLQYGVLIDLEYYGVIIPLVTSGPLSSQVAWNHIIYRLVIMIAACFAVAVLSGFLAVQAKIAKRELKLVEDHLKRVEKMATMGELAAGMAHEIKNPLASLSGSIQMLQEDSEPGTPNHKLMQIVLRETERLTRIVTEFLLFAKPTPLKSMQITLACEIEKTVKLFRQDALCRHFLSTDTIKYSSALNPQKTESLFCDDFKNKDGLATDTPDAQEKLPCESIEFELNLDDSISVNMDPDHFQQILWNLLKNAAEAIHSQRIHATETVPDMLKDGLYSSLSDTENKATLADLSNMDRGLISIRLFRSKEDRVLLKVSDNGCGIEQNDIDSVFNPFFTTKSYGTGLGLSIIHRLVDSYNGLIYVESNRGKGTTFTVILRENREDTSVSSRNKMLTPVDKME